LDFKLDLIFEKARVAHHVMAEDVPVGEASKDEVKEKYADQGYDGKRDKLAGDVVARPCRNGSENGGIISGW